MTKTARTRSCLIAAVAVLAGGAYAQQAVACAPVVDRTASQVAPHLQLVGSVASRGNCPSIRVADSSADGSVIWGVDWSGGLWRSTDDLASWTRTYQLPLTYKRIMNVLQLPSGHVLIHVMDEAGVESILRSTDATASAFSSVPSLLFPIGATIHGSPSWTAARGAIYVAGYGDQLAQVTLWKSIDDGVTFAPVFQLPGYLSSSPDPVRHLHDVFADPYDSARIWLTVGDRPGSRIGYSDNGGLTFTWITRATYPQSRAVGLFFSPSAVYWGTDGPETSNEVWRWDRSSGQLSQRLKNLPGPYYDGAQYNGVYAQFSTIPLTTDGGYTDEYAHVITASGDGRSWSQTALPWRRDPANTGETAIQQLISHPNSDGRFWVTYSNLVDARSQPVTDLEFRLTRR